MRTTPTIGRDFGEPPAGRPRENATSPTRQPARGRRGPRLSAAASLVVSGTYALWPIAGRSGASSDS
jgi:hypothetical protein